MSGLRGLVYYTPKSDGTGDIKIITFSPRPQDEVVGLSVVEFDPWWLLQFMQDEPQHGKYRLVFDSDGNPELDVVEVVIDTGRHEETFYQVEPYNDLPGVVAKVYPESGILKLRVWGYNKYLEDNRKRRFQFFITRPMEPNVILMQFTASIAEILERSIPNITGLPLGEPGEAYSIWAVSPDGNLKAWWTITNDDD